MEALRTAVSALSFYDQDEKAVDHDSNVRKAYALTSQIAMLVAAFDRIRNDKEVIEADKTLTHAGQFPVDAARREAVRYCDAHL